MVVITGSAHMFQDVEMTNTVPMEKIPAANKKRRCPQHDIHDLQLISCSASWHMEKTRRMSNSMAGCP
jgi:hypothetical protein